MIPATRGAAHSGKIPAPVRGRLNQAGRLITALVFGIGLVAWIRAGWMAGAIYGLKRAEPIVTAPAPPGVGLAPNLGPVAGGAAELGKGLLLGVGAGLVGGVVVMLLICRFVVVPLVRRVPRLTRRPT
jgi:hypothetical protein